MQDLASTDSVYLLETTRIVSYWLLVEFRKYVSHANRTYLLVAWLTKSMFILRKLSVENTLVLLNFLRVEKSMTVKRYLLQTQSIPAMIPYKTITTTAQSQKYFPNDKKVAEIFRSKNGERVERLLDLG